MSSIIGIDLGTTYSAVAVVRNGTPQILALGDERIMPSVVGLSPDGTLLVGTPARNQYAVHPERTLRSIKRSMGTETAATLGERSITPPQVSALILRELKRRAEAALGEPVSRTVITVPAYFSDAARQATREAGELAGFSVERIINEPTAAALAYGLDQSDERQLVAVYDLGGGTFDVSIIELDGGVVEVRASHGDTQLGGDDFDERLAEHLAEQFVAQHGVDPRSDIRARARLLRAAETAKIALSQRPTVQVQEEYLLTAEGRPLHLDLEVSRATFEELIGELLDGTLAAFDAALNDAGIVADELDKVILVGGSTRIPLIWSMLRDHTGIEPSAAVNPDEAVALGAAVQGGIIAGEPLEAILVDVAPHALGIEVAEFSFGQVVPDRYSVIIPRNTTIPTSRAEIYSALHPGQRTIELKIYQGEHAVASQNTLLGEFLFEDLVPETPGEPPRVTVTFDCDINGIVNVSAVDRGSGKEARTSVRAAHERLTPAQTAGVRAELDELEFGMDEFDDMATTGLTVPLNAPLDGAALDVETQSLLAHARTVQAQHPDHAELRAALATLEQAVAAGVAVQIDRAADALLDVLYELDVE
jgi:molecular chaperone DnaK